VSIYRQFEYNPSAYKGGHRVVACDYATVVTYWTADGFKFLIEFYDDKSKLFSVKMSCIRYATEQEALDMGFSLVGWYDRMVS